MGNYKQPRKIFPEFSSVTISNMTIYFCLLRVRKNALISGFLFFFNFQVCGTVMFVINMFYIPENGGTETKIKLKGAEGAEIFQFFICLYMGI